MAKDAKESQVMETGEWRKIQRLVELQNELVQQARKNEQTKNDCASLWRRLERDLRRATNGNARAADLAARLAAVRKRLLVELRARRLRLRRLPITAL